MSHFYGTLRGNRGPATRCGTKASGVVTHAAGWSGCVKVRVFHNDADDRDHFEVWLTPWKCSGGQSTLLAAGLLDSKEGVE